MELDTIICGDALEVLKTFPDECVDCVVTSPPYWFLRDYGVEGQIGLEKTPEEYVEKLVVVFREVRRVLKKQGTLWLNMGDSYNCYKANTGGTNYAGYRNQPTIQSGYGLQCKTLKNKDLVGIPWRIAFALQADGWWLRQDIIWVKPNPMPESVTDRCTKAHEYVFLLTKNAKYYYDVDAVRRPLKPKTYTAFGTSYRPQGNDGLGKVKSDNWGSSLKTKKPRLNKDGSIAGANLQDVWIIASEPFPEAHFATFPKALVEPCIKAGCPESGVVLDPFMGSGTVGLVAKSLGRNYIGIELNPEYVEMAERRIKGELFVEVR